MTGVVFIICVPAAAHEKHLKSKSRKRVFIKENRRLSRTSTQYGTSVLIDKFKERARSVDSLAEKSFLITLTGDNSPSKENYEYTSMEKLVRDILSWYKIEKCASVVNINEHYVQITFAIEAGEKCEDILDMLREHNVGQRYHSTMSIVPCSLYYQGCENPDDTNNFDPLEDGKYAPETAWTRFISSVRTRLTVAQIVEVLKSEAALTFDFICLVLIATIVCAIGLVDNSNLCLISSMLISPMMGPVMAGTFGTVIHDRMLQKIGVQNELIGLGIATLVGFCYGSIICLCTDKYGEYDWPTSEMISRGEIRNLGFGCLIALLSGAAVAVGILSHNIASLVGVAISTSLMPPAVNAGLLWSLASVYYVKGNETTRYVALSYTEYYSTDRFIELSTLGAVSMCLTFANIICIYISGILVFKIKEVAPIASKDPARRRFWKHDIKIARNYNMTLQKEDSKSIKGEMRDFKTELRENYEQLHHSSEFTRDNIHVQVHKPQHTWSPCMISQRPTMQELQGLYADLLKERSSPATPTFHQPAGLQHKKLFSEAGGEDMEPLLSNAGSSCSEVKGKGKKFTVTPVI